MYGRTRVSVFGIYLVVVSRGAHVFEMNLSTRHVWGFVSDYPQLVQ